MSGVRITAETMRVRAAMPCEPWLRRLVLWWRRPVGEKRIRRYCSECLRCQYTDATRARCAEILNARGGK